MSTEQSSTLRLLPGPDNLSARLAMFLLAILLVGVVLVILTALDVAELAPVDMRLTFVWVVLCASVLLLILTAGLWRVIVREVLRPLEQIRGEPLEQKGAGLGQVAATMRELRESVEKAQAELAESHRNLRHVEKLAMVGKLAAGVAHSVRNPLTSVKLRLFALERNLEMDDKRREDFAVIADAIRHVDSVVASFLEFSRRPALKLVETSPSPVLDGALALLENRLADFPVKLVVRRNSAMPSVLADPDQLREALLNILLNACEAMDYKGRLEVEESLVPGAGHSLYACIRVTDSGPGIPPELLPDIFTPFVSTKEQGTGLGLPIAKGILEEHGGDIHVLSSPRTGTSFSLLLPVVPPRPDARHRADIAAPV